METFKKTTPDKSTLKLYSCLRHMW